jgi:hypothetical protein
MLKVVHDEAEPNEASGSVLDEIVREAPRQMLAVALQAEVSCACRKFRPCRSSGISVLVNDSTEAILSMHGEVMNLVGFKDARHGAKWCSRGKGPMGPVLVVVPLILPQRVP